MVGACSISERHPDVTCAPADAFFQIFCQCLCQAVAKQFRYRGTIFVVVAAVVLLQLLQTYACTHYEGADEIISVLFAQYVVSQTLALALGILAAWHRQDMAVYHDFIVRRTVCRHYLCLCYEADSVLHFYLAEHLFCISPELLPVAFGTGIALQTPGLEEHIPIDISPHFCYRYLLIERTHRFLGRDGNLCGFLYVTPLTRFGKRETLWRLLLLGSGIFLP